MTSESPKNRQYFWSVGKRKTAIAHVRMYPEGSGEVTVNNKKLKQYFLTPFQIENALAPLALVERKNAFDIEAEIVGGGMSSQSDALRHGISRALLLVNPDFRPDELKIYPMVVTPHTELEGIWRNGGFVPYTDEILVDLMAKLQGIIPEYVRLNRMYRDIPASEILAGSHLANLRQVTDERMKKLGITRKDISAREIRDKGNTPGNAVLDVMEYEASSGKEYFLQWIDPVDRTVFSLLRLRVPSFVITSGTEQSI